MNPRLKRAERLFDQGHGPRLIRSEPQFACKRFNPKLIQHLQNAAHCHCNVGCFLAELEGLLSDFGATDFQTDVLKIVSTRKELLIRVNLEKAAPRVNDSGVEDGQEEPA